MIRFEPLHRYQLELDVTNDLWNLRDEGELGDLEAVAQGFEEPVRAEHHFPHGVFGWQRHGRHRQLE